MIDFPLPEKTFLTILGSMKFVWWILDEMVELC
jgi:hypothetical protein